MTTYTHDNGIIVGGTDRPGQIAIWSALADSPGDRCYIHPPQAEAIHAAYLHSLGLALWEHDGAQWLIPTEGRGPDDGRRIIRLSDHSMLWANPESTDDAFDRALASYLAAQTPPEPPQPGERWLLDGPDGPIPATVVEHEGQVAFVWTTRGDLCLRRVERFEAATYRRAES